MTPALQTDILHGVNPADTELHALLHEAALAPLDDLGWIRVTGEDRVRWLNGMVTNSITALAPGAGCFNFILSAQGRIQGTVYAFAQTDTILLQIDRAQIPTLLTLLDRFIIMDDVELTDITNTWSGLALIGPTAAALLKRLGLPAPETTAAPSLTTAAWHTGQVTLVTTHCPLVPRFELWADTLTLASLRQALAQAGVTPCSPKALETLRILEGTPRYGTDIRNSETARDLPQETAQTHALHFSKGCYLGQEIVERIHSRGNVHRTFTGFRLEGPLPGPGTPLHAAGKQVGELTSVAAIPSTTGTIQIALGYLRREAIGPLTYLLGGNPVGENPLGESPAGEAFPAPLPFQSL